MKPSVLLSPEELRDLVREAVRAELVATRSEEREILTRDQAAELVQVHPSVLIRYVKNDGLPAIRLGPEWRFKRSAIVQWLEERAVRPGAHVAVHAKRLRGVKGSG